MKRSDKEILLKCPGVEVELCVYLHPGEYCFATRPTLIHTILGSCVSVVLFDVASGYGAMCHAVSDTGFGSEQNRTCSHYMDCVIDEMIERFSQFRIPLNRLQVKLFGGASLLGKDEAAQILQPGTRNIAMARKMIREYGLKITTEDCGGYQGRKIFFCSHTGDVFLKRIRKLPD